MNTIVEHINSAGFSFIEFAVPMLVQSCMLIVILLLADLLLRKKIKAVFRYWIWMLVLLKLVLPTSLSSPLSLGYLFGDKLTYQELAETASVSEPTGSGAAETLPGINPLYIQPNPYVQPKVPVTSVVESEIAEPTGSPAPVTPLSWQGIVFLVWLAVVIAMGLLLLQRALFVRGLVAQAREAPRLMNDALEYCRASMNIKCKVGLKISPNATTPSVCGLIRPVILVPWNLVSTLGASRLRTVLMHELAHIKRADLWVNLAQTILQIMYFYNPLLWIANCMIRRIREQAVDEAVLVAMGEKAQKYPQTLVDVAKMAFKRPALSLRLIGVVESRSALAGRIKHILGRPMPKSARLGLISILVIIVAGAILLPMAKAKNEGGFSNKEVLIKFTELPEGEAKKVSVDDITIWSKSYQVEFVPGEDMLVTAEVYQAGKPMRILGNCIFEGSQKPEKFTVTFVRTYEDATKTYVTHNVKFQFGRQVFKIPEFTIYTARHCGKEAWDWYRGEGLWRAETWHTKTKYAGIETLFYCGFADASQESEDKARFWIPGRDVTAIMMHYCIALKMIPLSSLEYLSVEPVGGLQDLDGKIIPTDLTIEKANEMADDYRSNFTNYLPRAKVEKRADMEIDVQAASLDHFVGKYAVAGHPDTAAFEIKKESDVFIFRDLGGPKFEMDLFLKGLEGRRFEMEKGRDNLRFGNNPRERYRVRYNAAEDRYILDSLGMRGEVQDSMISPLTDLIKISPKKPDGTFAATLPNGVTVELMGLCKEPVDGAKWWKPDGSDMPGPFFRAGKRTPPLTGMTTQYTFLAKAQGGEDISIKMKIYEGFGWSTRVAEDGTALCYIKHPNDAKPHHADAFSHGPIEVGVAQGQWIKGRGESSPNIQTPRSYLIGSHDEIVIQPPRPEKNSPETSTIFWFTSSSHDYEYRLVCTLKDGSVEECMKPFFLSTNKIESGGLKNSTLDTKSFVIDRPLEQIVNYELLYRKFDYARFNNVAFKPNDKTYVQVEPSSPRPVYSATLPNGVMVEQPATIRVPDDYPTAYEAVKAAKDGDTLVISADRYRREDILIEPKLEFLAWHKTDRDNYWHADGSIVSDKNDLRILKNISHPGCGDPQHPNYEWLKLSFSHPSFDEKSYIELRMINDTGEHRKFVSVTAAGAENPEPRNGNLGWVLYTVSLGTKENFPRQCNFELDYAIGQWKTEIKELTKDDNGIMTFGSGFLLGSIGQNAEGKATIDYTHKKTETSHQQHRFVAVTQNGVVPPSGHVQGGYPDLYKEEYRFDIPLEQIQHFQFQTREVKTATFKNVSLDPNFKTDVQVEVEEVKPVLVDEIEAERVEVSLPIKKIFSDKSDKGGSFEWETSIVPRVRFRHGWYTVVDGVVRHHVGAGGSRIPEEGRINLKLDVEVDDNMLNLKVQRVEDLVAGSGTAAVAGKTSVPAGAYLKHDSSIDSAVLSDKHQNLWQGDFIRDGKVVKSVIYAAYLTTPDDLETGFKPPVLQKGEIVTAKVGPDVRQGIKETISPEKLVMLLIVLNSCAAETDLNIDSISITDRNISIKGDASDRANTRKFLDAVKSNGLNVSTLRLNAADKRDKFSIIVEPAEDWQKSWQQRKTDVQLGFEENISPKLVMLLVAMKNVAAEMDLNIESISVSAKGMSIEGDTSGRTDTLKFLDAIKDNGLDISRLNLDERNNRDRFRMDVEPKKDWRNWWQQHKTAVQVEVEDLREGAREGLVIDSTLNLAKDLTPKQLLELMKASREKYRSSDEKLKAMSYQHDPNNKPSKKLYFSREIISRYTEDKSFSKIVRTMHSKKDTNGNPLVTTRTYAIGPQKSKRLEEVSDNRTPRAIIALGNSLEGEQAFFTTKMALWDLFGWPWDKINFDQTKLSYNEKNNICLMRAKMGSSPRGPMVRLYIDPVKDFIPVKREFLKHDGTLLVAFSCDELRKTAEGLWIPYRYSWYDPRASFSAEYQVQEVVLNKPVPDNLLDFSFPDGTVVDDQIMNTQYKVTETEETGKRPDAGFGIESSVSLKLVMLLDAINSCAAETDLNIDSISISDRNISIKGDTSSRANSRKFLDAVKDNGLKVSSMRLNAAVNRDKFIIIVEPKQDWQQWWRQRKTDVQLGAEETVTPKLIMLLVAIKSVTAEMDLNIESISVSARSMSIEGDTSGRTDTLKFLDAIKDNGLDISRLNLDERNNRDGFRMTLEPKENWRQWWQQHKTAVQLEGQRKAGSVVQGKVLGTRGEPVKGATVELQIFVGGDVDDMTNYHAQRIFTDANGLYVFEGLKAGLAHIGRSFTVADGSISGVPHGLMFEFEIEPGRSYDITLGGRGRPVVGRLVPASGNAGDIDWSRARAYFCLQAAPFSMGSWESNAKIVKAMTKAEGGDFYRKSPVKINPDGTFWIDNVRAGLYMLRVKISEEPKKEGFNLFRDVRIPLMPDGTIETPLNLGSLAVSHGYYKAPRHIDNHFLSPLTLDKDIPVILKAGNDEEPDVVSAGNIRFSKDGELLKAALDIEWKSLVYEGWRARLCLLSGNGSYLVWHDVFFETSKMIEKYPLLFKETLNFYLEPQLDFSQIPRFTITIQPVSEILIGNEQPGSPAEIEILPAEVHPDVPVDVELTPAIPPKLGEFPPIVFERIAGDRGANKPMFVDVDTGRIWSPSFSLTPADVQKPVFLPNLACTGQLSDWVRRHGIDVAVQTDGKVIALMGMDMRAGKQLNTVESKSKSLTPSDVINCVKLTGADKDSGVVTFADLIDGEYLEASYPVITREGGVAVLEVAGLTDLRGPNGIRIRYQIVRYPQLSLSSGAGSNVSKEIAMVGGILGPFEGFLCIDTDKNSLRLRSPDGQQLVVMKDGSLDIWSNGELIGEAARLNTGVIDFDAARGEINIFGRGCEAAVKLDDGLIRAQWTDGKRSETKEGKSLNILLPEIEIMAYSDDKANEQTGVGLEVKEASEKSRLVSGGVVQTDLPVESVQSDEDSGAETAELVVPGEVKERGGITGVVVNSVTGKPIADAYVGVGDFGDSGGSNYSRHRSEGFHDKTKTDAEGRFELNGLVFTDKHRDLEYHPLVVTYPDFVRHDEKIELPSGGPVPDVTVKLRPAAKIEVTIVDADGNPLLGQWLIRLEALDGRRFIPPGRDPHLSSFASSIWVHWPDLRTQLGVSNGFTFTELDTGEYSIEALKFQLVDKPTPGNIWKPTINYHGAIPKIEIEAGRTKQVKIAPQDHQTKLTITAPEFPDKLFDKLERSSQMPLMCLISRSPGALLWDDGKIRHLEDQRLGRIDQKRFFRGFFIRGKPLTINNLPPDSYSLFTMAVYGQVAGYLIGARVDLAKGDDIILDIPWRQPTGPSMFGPNRSFDYPVNLETKDYSLSELCEILTETTQSNPRIIADSSIENEKLSFGKSEMSVWDLLEKLYLDNGWKVEEVPEKTLILEPKADSAAEERRVYLPDLETPRANVILDLATGEMLQAVWLKDNGAKKLGKGDIVYEYAGGKGSLLCLRGATMQLRTNEGLSPLEPDIRREYFVGYFLTDVPCQYQVTTAEGNKYELKVISIDKGDTGSAFIQFWKSEKKTNVPVEGEGAAEAKIERLRETGARRAIADRLEERIEFLGLDLTDAPRATNSADLPDLFEARPPGSKSYHIRNDVTAVYSGIDGVVYYVPDKEIFYIQHDKPGSSKLTYYGPFNGDPYIVLNLQTYPNYFYSNLLVVKAKPTIFPAKDSTTLQYEINMNGVSAAARKDYAERIIDILKKKIDRENEFKLAWKAVGEDKIEVTIPKDSEQRMKSIWGKAADGIACAVRPVKKTFVPGELLEFEVVYKNISHQPITVCVFPDPFYVWTQLRVLDSSGMWVASGQHANGIQLPINNSDFVTLQPGETSSVRQNISFSETSPLKPGRYIVFASLNKINAMWEHIVGYDEFCKENNLTPWAAVVETGRSPFKIVSDTDNQQSKMVEAVPIKGGPGKLSEVTDLPSSQKTESFHIPPGLTNVALNKPILSSGPEPIIGEIEMITDGDRTASAGSYVELHPSLQYITIDLEVVYEIQAISVWHYHKQARVYSDVVVQVAEDPDFTTNVRTVFNNDIDNSAGLGFGKDMHYIETNEGKLIDCNGVEARYVRLYSRGNTSDDLNHYVEVEVYAKSASEDGPRITFESLVCDLGQIPPNTKHVCEFKYTNTGNALLKITRVGAACACTVPQKTRECAPGESETLKVTYRASGHAGRITKRVDVYSNDKVNPKVALTIKAEIVVKVAHEPKILNILLKGENAGCPAIKLASIDNQPFSITGFKSTGDSITADFDPSVKETSLVIKPKADMEKLRKGLRGQVEISLTHPECKKISILFDTLPEFKTDPRVVYVRDAEPLKTVTKKVWIRSNYKEDVEIESTSSKKGTVKVLTQEKVLNGYQFELQITPPVQESNKRVFTDVFTVVLKGGQELTMTCYGIYSRKPAKTAVESAPETETHSDVEEASEKISQLIGLDLPASVQNMKFLSGSFEMASKSFIRFDIPLSDLKNLLAESDILPVFSDLHKNPRIQKDMDEVHKVFNIEWWKSGELESPVSSGWVKSSRIKGAPKDWIVNILNICCSQLNNNLMRVYISFYLDSPYLLANPYIEREIEDPRIWSQELAGDIFAALRANDNDRLKTLIADDGQFSELQEYRRDYDFSGLKKMVNYQKADRCYVIVSPIRHKKLKDSKREIQISFQLEQNTWKAHSIETTGIGAMDDLLKEEGFNVFSEVEIIREFQTASTSESANNSTVPVGESFGQARVVHFPADRSLGKLCVQRETIGAPVHWWWGLHNQWQYLRSPWQYLADARGDVTIPAGKNLGLIVGRDGLKAMAHLAKLRPVDLYMLKIKCGRNAVDKPGDDFVPYFAGLTGLKELILEYPGITNEGFRSIQRLSSLERLSLISRQLDDTGMAHIAELKSLKGLRFSSRDVTNAGLSHLSKLTLLEELFPIGTIDDEGLAHLTRLPALRYLLLATGDFTENGLAHLKGTPSLRKLDVGKIEFSSEGLAHISRIPGLEDLSISHTVLSDEDLVPLKSMNSLRRLSLSPAFQQMAPDFTDEALFHLSHVKSLESLVLGYGKFTDKGLEYLTELVNLKCLDIPNNSGFTDVGLTHLTKLPLLEELKLMANQFTDVGMSSIAKLTNLKRLELWGHRANITNKSLARLADMTKLSYLVIAGNFNDEGLVHVGNLDKLNHLDISGDFTDDGLHGLEGLNLLRQLKIRSENKLSPQALQDLRSKLPNLLVLS